LSLPWAASIGRARGLPSLELAGQTQVKPTTRERYEGVVRKHINPTWRNVKLSAVSHSEVEVWVTGLTKTQSPASVRKIHRVLSLMLDMAVRDGRLARNVAAQVNLPRPVKHERRYLTHAQVDALAHACGYPAEVSKRRAHDERTNEMYRLVVLFLAYTGVRFGEMAALRVGRIDLAKRRAVIAESVTPVQRLGMVWGTTKTHQRREVPIPRFLVENLAQHLKAGRRTISYSRASVAGTPCESTRSGRRSGRRPNRSACLTSTRTSCGTPPLPLRSPPVQTSRSCSRCSVTGRPQ